MAWIAGAVIGGIGLATSLSGAEKEADAQKDLGKLQLQRGAEQRDFNYMAASQIRAVGRFNSRDEKRQAKLIASRATAVAAAGGSLMDVGHLIADIHGEGAYRARLIMYETEVEADRLEYSGDQQVKYGADQQSATNAAAQGTRIRALGRAIQTGGQIYTTAQATPS